MENASCSTCRYVHQLSADNAECRRKAPRYMGKEKDCFARVSLDAWCGEWAGIKLTQPDTQPESCFYCGKNKPPAKQVICQDCVNLIIK